MADETATQAAPGFDAAAFADMVKGAVREVAQEAAASAPRLQPTPPPQPHVQRDPIADAVMPSIAPHLQAATAAGQSGTDAAVFYATTPSAGKHSDVIESMFAANAAQGRLIPRRDLWLYYKGANFEKFAAEDAAERQKAADLAQQAATVGGGMPRTLVSQTPKDPHDMQPDEMDQYLTDKVF